MGAAVVSPSRKVNFHNVNCVLSEHKRKGLNICVSVLICRGILFTFIQAQSRALAPPFSPGKASHQLKHCCCYFCRFTLIPFRQTYFTARRIHERQRRSLLTAPGTCQSLTRMHPQGPTFTHTQQQACCQCRQPWCFAWGAAQSSSRQVREDAELPRLSVVKISSVLSYSLGVFFPSTIPQF